MFGATDQAYGQVFQATVSAANLVEEIDAKSLKVHSIKDNGSIASWNLQNPNSAILLADQIISANGDRNVVLNEMKLSEGNMELVLAREVPCATYRVKFAKGSGKLGCHLSSDLRVVHLKDQGVVLEWNQMHPESPVLCGDQIVQVNLFAQISSMEAELSKHTSNDTTLILMRHTRQSNEGTLALALP